ncbi:MAG: tetratricopeptide repeat protein [Vicinamibacteria bacterium]
MEKGAQLLPRVFDVDLAHDPSVPPKCTLTATTGQGRPAVRRAHRTKALACFDRALMAESRQPVIRRHHAELLFQLGRLEEAVASGRELVGLTPEDPMAQLGLGTCLEKAERYEEALGAYERASGLEPESLELKLPALVCLLRLGRDGEFKERLRQLIRDHPEKAELRAMLGMMMQTEENLDEALPLYLEAYNLEPGSPILETVADVFLKPAESPKQKRRKRKKSRK